MVSRDAVFDDSKGWNWSMSNAEQQGEFVVSLGDFGNHYICDVKSASIENKAT